MDLTDLIELLKKNPRCNFIAMAITPLQAIGIDAVVSDLRDKGVPLNGYVLMMAHPETGHVLSRKNFNADYKGIEIIALDHTFKKKQGLIRNNQIKIKGLSYTKNTHDGNTVYLVWTEIFTDLLYVLSKTNPDDNVVFVQIDDGAASYIGDFQLRLSNLQSGVGYDMRKMITTYLKAGYYAFFSMIMKQNLKKNGRYINGTIFNKKKINGISRLEPNQEIISYYVNAFEMQGSIHDEAMRFEGSIIINTQCLAEGNITDGVIDLKVYKILADCIDDLGEHIVLKPHPRERDIEKYEKLGWDLIHDLSIPQESILANLDRKPKCIISIYSSTLLNAYGLFGIPAISLAKMMLQEDVSKTLKKELKRYIKMYEGLFYFPEDKEGLREIIKGILKNSRSPL